MAGHGVALACQAFVAADLRAGRLVRVTGHEMPAESDYYLVRKKRASQPAGPDKIWNWCRACLAA
jgi:LysR family glycine cleavage system transcriptional activator